MDKNEHILESYKILTLKPGKSVRSEAKNIFQDLKSKFNKFMVCGESHCTLKLDLLESTHNFSKIEKYNEKLQKLIASIPKEVDLEFTEKIFFVKLSDKTVEKSLKLAIKSLDNHLKQFETFVECLFERRDKKQSKLTLGQIFDDVNTRKNIDRSDNTNCDDLKSKINKLINCGKDLNLVKIARYLCGISKHDEIHLNFPEIHFGELSASIFFKIISFEFE